MCRGREESTICCDGVILNACRGVAGRKFATERPREGMLGNGRKVCYTTLMAKKINPGQKFGNLTVISDTGERKRGRSIWNCRCICGSEVVRTSEQLVNPRKQSCGKTECAVPVPEVAPGAKFGKLTVIEYDHTNEHRAIFWKCRCECGREVLVRGQCLRNGMTVSCGNKGCRQGGDLSRHVGDCHLCENVTKLLQKCYILPTFGWGDFVL